MSRQDIERMNSATKDEEDGHIEDLPKGKEPLSPAERQEAFEAALKIDPGVKSFSWQALQVRSLFISLDCPSPGIAACRHVSEGTDRQRRCT